MVQYLDFIYPCHLLTCRAVSPGQKGLGHKSRLLKTNSWIASDREDRSHEQDRDGDHSAFCLPSDDPSTLAS